MWKDGELERALTGITLMGLGGLIFGIARGLIQKRYGGWVQWISMLTASVVVAILVGLAIDDSNLTLNQKYAVAGLCSFLAEDIVLGFIMLAGFFRSDPLGAIQQFWNAIRGVRTPKGDDK